MGRPHKRAEHTAPALCPHRAATQRWNRAGCLQRLSENTGTTFPPRSRRTRCVEVLRCAADMRQEDLAGGLLQRGKSCLMQHKAVVFAAPQPATHKLSPRPATPLRSPAACPKAGRGCDPADVRPAAARFEVHVRQPHRPEHGAQGARGAAVAVPGRDAADPCSGACACACA